MTEMKQDNARDPEQLLRMKNLQEEGLCFFCDENYIKVGAGAAVVQSKWWYIMKNDYPYKGTNFHYLVVSKKHVRKLSELTPEAWAGLQEMFQWIENNCSTPGMSVFVRLGDLNYTGATIDHLHFHAISGGPKQEGSQLDDNLLVTLGHKVK